MYNIQQIWSSVTFHITNFIIHRWYIFWLSFMSTIFWAISGQHCISFIAFTAKTLNMLVECYLEVSSYLISVDFWPGLWPEVLIIIVWKNKTAFYIIHKWGMWNRHHTYYPFTVVSRTVPLHRKAPMHYEWKCFVRHIRNSKK
jgi:hypothetical protein